MSEWTVVYDVDDVLWGLNTSITARLGIPMSRIVDFHADDNPELTPAERKALVAAYGAPETFRHMTLYPNLTEIMRITELGLNFEIRSNSYCQEIADIKRALLEKSLPGLRPEQLHLPVVVHGSTSLVKPMPEKLLILVDDSPYNVAKSAARGYILPRWPYNDNPRAHQLMGARLRRYVEPGDCATLARAVEALARDLLA